MRKKLTISLTFLFVLSTVGMPISMHFCEMQDIASFSACEMHSHKNIEKESSCCENEDDYSVQLKSDNSDQCCYSQIINKSISDNFIDVQIELKKGQTISVAVPNHLISNYYGLDNYIAKQNLSPPLIPHSDLYLQISVLLI